MNTDSSSFIDRVGIAFGAMILGCGAALSAAFPLLLILGVFYADLDRIAPFLIWKFPVSVGIISGVAGFISPEIAANLLGKIWKDAVFIWRAFAGR